MKKVYKIFSLSITFFAVLAFSVFALNLYEFSKISDNKYFTVLTQNKNSSCKRTPIQLLKNRRQSNASQLDLNCKKVYDLKNEENSNLNYLDFSLKLFQNCYKNKNANENVLISPLSVMVALLMASTGASGETKTQILNLLNIQFEIQAKKELKNIFSSNEENLKSANSLWITDDENFSLNKNFENNLKQNFDARTEKVDFLSEKTIQKINDWCSEKTNGLIKHLVEEGDFSKDTLLSLINAIYFDALWAEKYEAYDLSDRNFYGKDENKIAQFMNSTENVFIQGERESGFEKMYAGEKFSFVALLPNENIDIDEYVGGLSTDYLANLLKNKRTEKVECYLPKFSSEFSSSLQSILNNMGMVNAFSPNLADFSNLGKIKTGENIYIDKIIHKSNIEVTPLGTKASAITAIMISKCAMRDFSQNVVMLNRPFVYMINDTKTNLPVFIGVCENV